MNHHSGAGRRRVLTAHVRVRGSDWTQGSMALCSERLRFQALLLIIMGLGGSYLSVVIIKPEYLVRNQCLSWPTHAGPVQLEEQWYVNDLLRVRCTHIYENFVTSVPFLWDVRSICSKVGILSSVLVPELGRACSTHKLGRPFSWTRKIYDLISQKPHHKNLIELVTHYLPISAQIKRTVWPPDSHPLASAQCIIVYSASSGAVIR